MSVAAQRRIREDAEEAQSYLADLASWQRDVKARRLRRSKTSGLAPRRRLGEVELSGVVGRRGTDATSSSMADSADTIAAAQAKREAGNDAFKRGNYGRAIELYTDSIDLHATHLG